MSGAIPFPINIAASNVCHPSYAAYLISRQTLTMKDIEKIIQSIPEQAKILYDQKLIERLYAQFQSKKIDDTDACRKFLPGIGKEASSSRSRRQSAFLRAAYFRFYRERSGPMSSLSTLPISDILLTPVLSAAINGWISSVGISGVLVMSRRL